MQMKDLATCTDIDPSYVTLVADVSRSWGLIERQPRPTDRRVKDLVLTAKGCRLKKTIQDKLGTGPTMFFALTSADRTRLTDTRTKVAAGGAVRRPQL